MSVYQMTYSQMLTNRQINLTTNWDGHYLPNWEVLAQKRLNEFKCLKETLENTDHTFIFIITKDQWPGWTKMFEEYGYKEYLVYEMPYFVHNFNYTVARGYYEHNGGGRRLRLVILKGKGKNEN